MAELRLAQLSLLPVWGRVPLVRVPLRRADKGRSDEMRVIL